MPICKSWNRLASVWFIDYGLPGAVPSLSTCTQEYSGAESVRNQVRFFFLIILDDLGNILRFSFFILVLGTIYVYHWGIEEAGFIPENLYLFIYFRNRVLYFQIFFIWALVVPVGGKCDDSRYEKYSSKYSNRISFVVLLFGELR